MVDELLQTLASAVIAYAAVSLVSYVYKCREEMQL